MNTSARTTVAALITAVITPTALAESAQRWTMNELSVPGYDHTVVNDLNNAGQMTGFTNQLGEPWWTQKPLYWQGDAGTALDAEGDQAHGVLINESGVAFGFNRSPRQLLRMTESGTEVIADLGMCTGDPTLVAVNEAGMVAGYAKVGGSSRAAFRWDEQNGLLFFHVGAGCAVTDMNESGEVVGHTSSPRSAFLFTSDCVCLDIGASLGGINWATSIDDDGQISIIKQMTGTHQVYRYEKSSGKSELILEEPDELESGFNQPLVKGNDSGAIAISWPKDNDDQFIRDIAQLGIWTAEDGLVQIPTDEEFVFIELLEFNESDMIAGRALDMGYENVFFVASKELGFMKLPERIIGAEFDHFPLVRHLALNDAGQLALQLDTDFNYGTSVLLSPARAGDVNGDDQVGIDDLLLIIGNWGAWSGELVGYLPDLDADGQVNINDLLLCIGDWG
jgi:hypothetical protein